MDIAALGKTAAQWLKKYKYVLLVLLVGLGLMVLPEKKDVQSADINVEENDTQESTHEQLGKILSSIDGAGKVEVLLTVKTGEETIYQTNSNVSAGENNSSSQITTVVITTSSKAETGLVRQVNPPVYLGAVIVCQGADSPSVRLAIVDAVSDATGLGADQISVLKMK